MVEHGKYFVNKAEKKYLLVGKSIWLRNKSSIDYLFPKTWGVGTFFMHQWQFPGPNQELVAPSWQLLLVNQLQQKMVEYPS